MKNTNRETKTIHFTPEIREIFSILTNEDIGSIVCALIEDSDIDGVPVLKGKHLQVALIAIQFEEDRHKRMCEGGRKGGLAKALNAKKRKCTTKQIKGKKSCLN